MFLIFVGDFNKYLKHMFYEEMGIKQNLSYMSFLPIKDSLLQQINLMTTSLGTNAVFVTRVHCTCHLKGDHS